MEKYKFKFSVIIPIYNVEEYLEETVESVINQTIGFKDNIQLILVNDGSKDNSEVICLKYQKMYPDNIKYIKKENGGVSSARNKGLEYVDGELVNFLDSDDKWSNDSFDEVYNAYQKNPTIKIFSCKMIFFDGRKGDHILNYKYNTDKIINIFHQYANPQLSSSSLFVHEELVKGHKYELGIKFSEDNRFINEIILKQKEYMALSKPIYYYRRRSDASSAIQTQTKQESYYTVTPKEVYQYLFDYSRKIYNRVIPYIQYLVLYDLSYRINVEENNNLITKDYIDTFIELIKQIDDYVILNHRNLDFAKKVFLLSLKNNEDYIEKINYYRTGIQFEGINTSRKNLGFLIIDNTIFRNDKMILFGKLDTKFANKHEFKVTLNDNEVKVDYYELANNYDELTFNGEFLHKYIGIKIEVPITNEFSLKFFYKDLQLIPRFKRSSYFFEDMPRTYHIYKNKTFVFKTDRIICEKTNKLKNLRYERINIRYLKNKKKVALIRLFIKLARPFKFKKIMIISDRINKADDNGEHFFKYMNKYHKNIKTYFLLSKNSPDYNRLKKYGNVLDPNSKKYKLLFQISDYIVSSHAENYIFEPLGKSSKYIHDQYYFKYIFLQHGITKDDLSPWININTKKMDMFVTAAKPEYESMLKYNYQFNKNIVKLTGFPRFDNLINRQNNINIKKQILISFTWRNSLTNAINSKTGERLYNPEFKNSEYFKNINKLLNDKKLIDSLKKYNYQIKFLPHPNLICQMDDFTKNDYVIFETKQIDYQKEFCENALLVTDYSSVFFDFAYLNKPVIYYQYDIKDYFENQLYNKGYFDFEKNGFGPVCFNYEKLIEEIINTVKNDCKLDKKYQKRINDFYTYHDQNNCERVYNEIINLDKE